MRFECGLEVFFKYYEGILMTKIERFLSALRVPPAETRLTVYRRRAVFLQSEMQNGSQFDCAKIPRLEIVCTI